MRKHRKNWGRSRRFRGGCLLLLLAVTCILAALLPSVRRTELPAPEADVQSQALADPAQPEEPSQQAPVIVLDAGHGGKDPGSSCWGADEKDITLEIVEKAARLLRDEGYEVLLTREDDTWVAKEDRPVFASEHAADLFISVHLNALEDDSVTHGIETYCNEAACGGSAALARAVQSHVVAETGGKDRGVITDSDFYVVHHAEVPACLLEAGFLTAREEGALLMDGAYQDKIAAGIAAAVKELIQKV